MTFCLWFSAITAIYFWSSQWRQLSLALFIHNVLLSLPQPNKIDRFTITDGDRKTICSVYLYNIRKLPIWIKWGSALSENLTSGPPDSPWQVPFASLGKLAQKIWSRNQFGSIVLICSYFIPNLGTWYSCWQ